MPDSQPTDDFVARLEALRRGDEAVRNEVLEGVLPQIEAYVRLNLGAQLRARESCSDLVQTICREVLLDVGDFRGQAERQFRGWLLRVAQRKIHSRQRAAQAMRRDVRREVPLEVTDEAGRRRLLTTYATLATPSRDLSMREAVDRIEAAIATLPEDQRHVLTASCIFGLSHREIAEDLGKEEATVRKILSRARARLTLLLATEEQDGLG